MLVGGLTVGEGGTASRAGGVSKLLAGLWKRGDCWLVVGGLTLPAGGDYQGGREVG